MQQVTIVAAAATAATLTERGRIEPTGSLQGKLLQHYIKSQPVSSWNYLSLKSFVNIFLFDVKVFSSYNECTFDGDLNDSST